MKVASIIQPGVEVQELHSSVIDQEFQLYIKLPWNYDRVDTIYPVLFCLDGNRSFPLYSTMSLIYETPGTDSKEIIIVRIGYKVDGDRIKGLADWAAWRTRDLTPERNEEVERFWKKRLSSLLEGDDRDIQTGGASIFLELLCEELIPFIEANYRVSSGQRGLAGYSYGGLFTLYVLFHASEMFSRYFAGSPSMCDQLCEYEEDYSSLHDDLRARVFITAGALELDLVKQVQNLKERLCSRGYLGLELRTHVFDGEEHASAYAAYVSRALRVLYSENWTIT